ncbi:NAD-dependent epimerase/dehydratase family protein [Candidatus Levibacter sp. Uisw_134_01]|uniref:NAD-dependent epimerase/dehydratase family protein n=1 Tax=Candidatus Levibacter sp. Uisw_134_01 TaxID=3230999 RepID=UPI003D3D92CD
MLIIGEIAINNTALVTGSSGFIGFHLSSLLLSCDWTVIGLDSMTNYYDVNLKKARLAKLNENLNFQNYTGLVQNEKLLEKIFSKHKPSIVVHLAAQAGVRYSIDQPLSYVESNLIGTFQILEISRKYSPKHLLIASTSSVYGSNKEFPLNENQRTSTPMSFYAATKKSNEIMAHSYSHLFNIPTTIFRFFTVYGPWGRPDMALFKFTKNILADTPIDVYNKGNMVRDFTYVSDLVKAIFLLITKIPKKPNSRKVIFKNDSISDVAPFRVVNIGNSQPVNLLDYIKELERVLQKNAKKNFMDMQDGDIHKTHSNVSLLEALTDFSPKTTVRQGITEFVKWYKAYYV